MRVPNNVRVTDDDKHVLCHTDTRLWRICNNATFIA